MSALLKYGITLASGLAIGSSVNGPPSLEHIGRAARIDQIAGFVDGVAGSTPPAATAVDPAAAGKVNEELDYLIAKHADAPEAWRAFLAAHPDGAHAAAAQAEIDSLTRPALARAPEPASEGVEPAAPPEEAKAAPPAEVCHSDASCSRGPSAAGDADPAASEPRALPAAHRIEAAPMPGAWLRSAQRTGPDRHKPVAHEASASSHAVRHGRRHCDFDPACSAKARNLPLLLQAILGVKPRHASHASAMRVAEATPGEFNRR